MIQCRFRKQINRIHKLLLLFPPEQINVIELLFRGAPTTIPETDKLITSC